MNAKIVVLAIVLGAGLEAYTIGDGLSHMTTAQLTRFIVGTIVWAVFIGAVLSLVLFLFRRLSRNRGNLD